MRGVSNIFSRKGRKGKKKVTKYQSDRVKRVGGGVVAPSSHTTGRTVPYPAVSVLALLFSSVPVVLKAAQLSLTDSVRYFQLSGPLSRHLPKTIRTSDALLKRIQPFTGWSDRLLWPLLTSASPSHRLSTVVAHTGQAGRPPRVRRATFLPYTRRIYFHTLRMTIGL